MTDAQQEPIIFQDTFKILDVDPDGKKFDKGRAFVQRSSPFPSLSLSLSQPIVLQYLDSDVVETCTRWTSFWTSTPVYTTFRFGCHPNHAASLSHLPQLFHQQCHCRMPRSLTWC